MENEEQLTLLNEQECEFVLANAKADVNALRLKHCPAKLANAIEARSKIARKLPLWYEHPELLYPSILSVQQCSSQATASYKRMLLQGLFNSCRDCLRAADLTGGIGVDSLFLSSLCNSFLYVERNSELCESVRENFRLLASDRQYGCISFSNREISAENLEALLGREHYDFIFVDPARRSASDSSKKLVALSEYTPDILTMKDQLLRKCTYLLVKVSPMVDISQVLRELPETAQIHVVSVDNDCKELLLLLKESRESNEGVEVFAVDLPADFGNDFQAEPSKAECEMHTFRFMLGQERANAQSVDAKALLSGEYNTFYEPGKSILKCGAAALQASLYGLKQLAPASNLFVDNTEYDADCHRCRKEEYQGRRYRILEVLPFSKKVLKEIFRKYPNAGVTARNFPMSTNAIVSASKTKESAPEHLFFTTLSNGCKIIIVVLR